MEESPQMLRRWGDFRQSYTEREKDDWVEDFVRALASAPPPKPEPAPVPPVKAPEQRPLSHTERVFAKLRADLDHW